MFLFPLSAVLSRSPDSCKVDVGFNHLMKQQCMMLNTQSLFMATCMLFSAFYDKDGQYAKGGVMLPC